MTITEGDLPTALDRCDNSDTMFTVYQNCFECVAELGLKTTYYGREAGGKVLAVYNTEGEMNDSEGFYTCNDYYKFIWLDDW